MAPLQGLMSDGDDKLRERGRPLGFERPPPASMDVEVIVRPVVATEAQLEARLWPLVTGTADATGCRQVAAGDGDSEGVLDIQRLERSWQLSVVRGEGARAGASVFGCGEWCQGAASRGVVLVAGSGVGEWWGLAESATAGAPLDPGETEAKRAQSGAGQFAITPWLHLAGEGREAETTGCRPLPVADGERASAGAGAHSCSESCLDALCSAGKGEVSRDIASVTGVGVG